LLPSATYAGTQRGFTDAAGGGARPAVTASVPDRKACDDDADAAAGARLRS